MIVCTDSIIQQFILSTYPHIFRSFLPSLFLSFSLPSSFLFLRTEHREFSIYSKSISAFVLHIQANFKIHAPVTLDTALFQAIGVLCELLTYIFLHIHTSVQTRIHTSIRR